MGGLGSYNNQARITFDKAKREQTVAERGLDFADAELVFAGVTLEMEDTRKDYGERRYQAIGMIGEDLHMLVFTPRDSGVHVISPRRANQRERTRYARQAKPRAD